MHGSEWKYIDLSAEQVLAGEIRWLKDIVLGVFALERLPQDAALFCKKLEGGASRLYLSPKAVSIVGRFILERRNAVACEKPSAVDMLLAGVADSPKRLGIAVREREQRNGSSANPN